MSLFAQFISFLTALFTRLIIPAAVPPPPVPSINPPAPTYIVIPSPILNKPIQTPAVTPDNEPWGVARQLDTHTWQIRVANDSVMGTPDEILTALNNLRIRYGSQPLKTDPRLCDYANKRAIYQDTLKTTDAHAGFIDFLNHQDGFSQLGFGRLGENSSYGYVLSGVHLIEFVYHSDPDHDKNQLDSRWDHGCVGTSGKTTDIIFATSPL